MAKALVLNSPLHGHVYPTLAVARELVQRGEEVTCYLTAEFEQAVRATGASFRAYDSITRTYDVMSDRLSRFLAEEARHVIPQVLEAIQAEQPDYILYEAICLWGRLLAHHLRVPAIACRIMLAENEFFKVVPPVPPASIALTMLYKQRDFASLNAFCQAYGLPQPGDADMRSLFLPYAEDLNIVFIPRSFQPAGETFDELRFVFVGPCLADRAADEAVLQETQPAAGEYPLLYISLGTLFNAQQAFFQQCMQAFGGLPWRVILALGQRVARSALEPIPDNIQAHPYVDQLKVLREAAVFLTHGGTNSVMEALFYGVPMVVVPSMGEQMVYARRVEELGAGIVIEPETVTVERLREAVNTVLSEPRFRQRARQMQESMRAAGGAQQAADALLQFVDSRKEPECKTW